MIPRIFHRIWMQGPPPSKYDDMVTSWKQFHPTWEVKTWTEDMMKPLVDPDWQRVLEMCTLLIQRADVYRLILLEIYGGVYIDCDMYALKSLEPLMHDSRVQLGGCHGTLASAFITVNNGIIIAPPRLPVWKSCVIPELLRAFSTQTVLDALVTVRVIRTTGPLVWARIVAREPSKFLVHTPEAFYSLRVKKRMPIESVRKTLTESYVYHVQDSAWLGGWERGVMMCLMNAKWMLILLLLICLKFLL